MGFVFLGLSGLCVLGQFIAMIMVIVKMFQQNQTGLGVATILLSFCGFGPIIAFIVGWIHANDWGLRKIMLAWTGLIVAGILFYGIGLAFMPTLVVVDPSSV